MTQEELNEILEKHRKWLNDEEGGERADLRWADLRWADLSGADLSRANLSGADLSGADLDESEKIRQGVCLEESMIGYKKCQDGVIVTLKIPKGAIVFSINNSKCRTNVAKVTDIDNGLTKVASCYDSKFIYRKGKTVRANNFNCQYNEECASGIHFFRTREEAEKY